MLSTAWKYARFGNPLALLSVMTEKILIIDDDEQLTTAYRDYLEKLDYQVDCAREVEEAETLLTHFNYSVVITDLRLSKLGFGG